MDASKLSNADISSLVQSRAYLTLPGLSQALLDRWAVLSGQGLGQPCPLDRGFWLHYDSGLLSRDSEGEEQQFGGSFLRSGKVAQTEGTEVAGTSGTSDQPSTSSMSNFTIEREEQKQYSKRFRVQCKSHLGNSIHRDMEYTLHIILGEAFSVKFGEQFETVSDMTQVFDQLIQTGFSAAATEKSLCGLEISHKDFKKGNFIVPFSTKEKLSSTAVMESFEKLYQYNSDIPLSEISVRCVLVDPPLGNIGGRKRFVFNVDKYVKENWRSLLQIPNTKEENCLLRYVSTCHITCQFLCQFLYFAGQLCLGRHMQGAMNLLNLRGSGTL